MCLTVFFAVPVFRRRPGEKRRFCEFINSRTSNMLCLATSIILAAGIASFAENADNMNSGNARMRRETIITAAHSRNANLAAILRQGLGDPSPLVVEEAVKQIGRLGLTDETLRLIALYDEADRRFGGYAERVKIEVIAAMGALGGDAARKQLAGLLEADNGSIFGEYILLACGRINDVALIPDLRRYAARMEALVQAGRTANRDPITFSMKQRYVDLCAEIVVSLVAKGGK